MNRMFFAQNIMSTIYEHFGRLYNGYSVATNKLAPSGWYIPSVDNFIDLITTVGYGLYNASDGTYTLAGGHLKKVELNTWLSPNTGADNSVGFSALGAGYRTSGGVFQDMNRFTDFWSTTAIATGFSRDLWVAYNDATARTRALNNHNYGVSIRCRRPIGSYGALYNWLAVSNPKNLAPLNCHIPTSAEVDTLITYLGGSGTAGIKIKEAGNTNWLPSGVSSDNSSRFLGLPNGERNYNGGFYQLGSAGFWWTSTIGSVYPEYAMSFSAYSSVNDIIVYEVANGNGYGVRCICDTNADTITDIDGNVYETVVIGTQRWLVQDLKVTKYRDGTAIPVITDGGAWRDAAYAETAGMCYYENSLPIANQPTTVTDIDNNTYNVIRVGNNLWTDSNFKSTKYNDGTPIPNVTDSATWASLTTGAMCAYNNDENNV